MTTKIAFRYSHTIGFYATEGRGFAGPVDVALDSDGVLYVANRAGFEAPVRLLHKRITICTVDEEYLGQFGRGGAGDGEFWWPSSLAFDSQDRLYVADEGLHRISIFAKGGDFLGNWGVPGAGDGQLNRPAAIAFDPEDNLFLTDSLNHRVQKFTKEGKFLAKWGEPGSGPGQFNMPWGVALDRQGNVYVSDWRNDRIQKFDPMGNFLGQWGTSGVGEGQFHRPAGVAVDTEGIIYVADWGNGRVQALSPQGEPMAILRGESGLSRWGEAYLASVPDEAAARRESNLEPELGPRPWSEDYRDEAAIVEKLMWGPTAIKLDDQGRIYVVDSCRHRLQVYRKEI